MAKFRYGGTQHTIMSLEDAVAERERRVAAGEKDVCIISCHVYGGGADDYIVVITQRPEGGE